MTETPPVSLVACPLCGAAEGYTLGDGDTFKWWLVRCAACGDIVAECGSDRTTRLDEPKPARWPAADDAWNAAGAYAQGLRDLVLRLQERLDWLWVQATPDIAPGWVGIPTVEWESIMQGYDAGLKDTE